MSSATSTGRATVGRVPALRGGEAGQASVEVVAIAPVVGLFVVGLALALQAHAAGEAAGLAAHAAGIAVMQGRDPKAAAREAVPDVDRDRLRVTVDGGTVRVWVRASGPRALVAPFDADRRVVARPVGGR
ncbi:hypothetical protein [Patulibacter minatonensis]|uniref:hypothetical protein n=1 Tax=Patulibacter minatonensis TaxID=298163 RepID=UPI00047B3C0F|nr:hypothetical protein [Patulibacter minatonensis]